MKKGDKKVRTVEVEDRYPLRWPDGYPRTLLNNRKANGSWQKSFSDYRDAVIEELDRMKVSSATITRNELALEDKDPGVAIWYSMKAGGDYDWQVGLGIDNPVPTLEDVDRAYKVLAMKYHPDRNPDRPDYVELFKQAGVWREKAKAYVLGSAVLQQDNCLAFDQFKTAKMNLAAALSALRHFRGLERLGMPFIVSRIMTHAFKTALPEKATVIHGTPAA